ARVVVGLEPAGPQLHAPGRQPGEAPLELGAPRAVAGDEDDEIREPPAAAGRLPAADAIFQLHDGVDRDVKVLVLGPAGRAHDESDDPAAETKPREERLPELLARGSLDR